MEKIEPYRDDSYWRVVWRRFRRHKIGFASLIVILFFVVVGLYAPFLASSKPLVVFFDGEWYFPLFRYLFFSGFYTKKIDLFFNLLMFTLPVALIAAWRFHRPWRRLALAGLGILQLSLFLYLGWRTPHDPEASVLLMQERQEALAATARLPSWEFDLSSMTPYARLNQVIRYRLQRRQHEAFAKRYRDGYVTLAKERWLARAARTRRTELLAQGVSFEQIPSLDRLKEEVLTETPEQVIEEQLALPTLWSERQIHFRDEVARQREILTRGALGEEASKLAQAKLAYLLDREAWLEQEQSKISLSLMPLVRSFHWEDDAGGEQSLNRYVRWYDLTRINRKDLLASLLFGIRISLVVGSTAVAISLLIGIPVGALAGYRGGRTDIWVMRGIEVWESMPTFFMLLMVVAILQSKSIFIVIAVLGIFGWTGFSRFLRGEVLKQRNLSYVEACRAMGYTDRRIVFSHILPNAIPPLLTLLPFSIMVAITSEAGLSFLGLGEEGSCSWGVLMDEGRTAFPAESYLLWPPAIMLTTLLVAIALVGDALRDALDPKMIR